MGLDIPVVPGKESVSIFPNPASEELCIMVKTNKSQTLNWDIFDETGRTILSGTMFCQPKKDNLLSINLSNHILSPGFYFYRIGDISGKFIIY